MSNPTCDICGREMAWKINAPPYVGGAYACSATPDQHKIAVLEKKLAKALLPCHRSHPHEDDPSCPFNSEAHVSVLRSNAALRCECDETQSKLEEAQAENAELRSALHDHQQMDAEAQAQLRESQERELALREAMDHCRAHGGRTPAFIKHCEPALSNTSATAQQTVQRIEREALEKAWELLTNPPEANPTGYCGDSGNDWIEVPWNFARWAILGEHHG